MFLVNSPVMVWFNKIICAFESHCRERCHFMSVFHVTHEAGMWDKKCPLRHDPRPPFFPSSSSFYVMRVCVCAFMRVCARAHACVCVCVCVCMRRLLANDSRKRLWIRLFTGDLITWSIRVSFALVQHYDRHGWLRVKRWGRTGI